MAVSDEKEHGNAVETVSQKSGDAERATAGDEDVKLTFKTKLAVFVSAFDVFSQAGTS